ncbi:hypothetical protein [Massilia pseudoviolaceinigra]|uniref:hypothetical protein n=1 Tax=Massilia pseudoviolaceinigra TaxID=3057165 RepID=UPI0027964758|nr:hypothetical protein [Massilia sp. CCM 9206]MDQ1921633.1 hypothetical protein [Massilia sp. CCM 9206]
MSALPTIKVASPQSPDNPQGFVIINRADFDSQVHELYGNDNDHAALAERIPTKNELLAAHEELERRAAADARNAAEQLAQLQSMRADLDAQAIAQNAKEAALDAENQRLRAEAAKQAEAATANASATPAKGKAGKSE